MESKLSCINCFIISLLSISLLASPINGRIILDYKHGRELKEQSMRHSIKDNTVFQGDSSFNSHSNPWANYWVYAAAANNAKNEDEDLDKSKFEAIKSLINKEGMSFGSHLNPWANYWIYDNANNKKLTKDEVNVKNEEDLNESNKIEALKDLLNKEDKSFVGHLNPWANYWIYDSANKKSTNNDQNNVKIEEEDFNESKIEALKNILQKQDESFVGHSNPWANYWIYDNANKKSSKDENNVKVDEEDLNELKIKTLRDLMENKDKSFVGHSNPWANYWIYDSANKKLNKDENNVKNEELIESKIEALKELVKKEEKSFVRHSNPWANYWIYDNANKKSSKVENNVKNQEDLSESKIDALKDLKKGDNSKDNNNNVVLKQSV